jgi:hypothetical protein
LVERVELLLVEHKYDQAKETFQTLTKKVDERKENKKLAYCDFIEFKRLEKIIINEFSKQNEFFATSME